MLTGAQLGALILCAPVFAGITVGVILDVRHMLTRKVTR